MEIKTCQTKGSALGCYRIKRDNSTYYAQLYPTKPSARYKYKLNLYHIKDKKFILIPCYKPESSTIYYDILKFVANKYENDLKLAQYIQDEQTLLENTIDDI